MPLAFNEDIAIPAQARVSLQCLNQFKVASDTIEGLGKTISSQRLEFSIYGQAVCLCYQSCQMYISYDVDEAP